MIPKWIIVWFIISNILCFYDCAFLLTRPESLKGGSLYWLFSGYTEMYGVADPKYLDMKDGFVLAQCYVNMVEMLFNTLSLFFYFTSSVKNSAMFGLVASVMTCSKTVLYFLMDYFNATVAGLNVFHKTEPLSYFLIFYVGCSQIFQLNSFKR
eukprot:gene2577-3539_t